ncbi:DUF5054 domain-containing protein [Vallitalea okinawensis]|uniref:DUF5054 domain-containing protein n=1 Tax=Vallitalea okinawensis TaxID=2078660 RepID=UPI001A9A4921|nr:DUF5054 domain-containing protein [Vallitalea okinawensis]
MKKVHVIYKTHLDIGFTNLAKDVVEQYTNHFIIKALDLAEALNQSGEPPVFVWTTGSWLIQEFLRRQSAEEVKRMEECIKKGWISWHALPFTTHTELMDQELFEFGLSISQKLDKRFGKTTIAGKMTDVPGHTKAIIPLLQSHGIQYLHIGVNPTSKNPDVPKLFLWRDEETGTEIIVNYAATYGEVLDVDFVEDILTFANTGDNTGPPSKEDVLANFNGLQTKYEGYEVTASTLNAFAEQLWAVRDQLPVVTEEIGDTWIHGVGTDPKKVAYYRELLRLKEEWIREGRLIKGSNEYNRFLEKLIMIPEHTWALDLKKHLADFKNYLKEDFKRARQDDILDEDAVPEKYKYIRLFALNEKEETSSGMDHLTEKSSYSFYESAWKEQRQYIEQAIDALSEDKKLEVSKHIEMLTPTISDLNGEVLETNVCYKINGFSVKFLEDGTIDYLVDPDGYQWCDAKHPLGNIMYEAYGVDDYDYWFEHYMCNLEKTYQWATADFNKPGMDLLKNTTKNKRFLPTVQEIVKVDDQIRLLLKFDPISSEEYGCPRKVIITYRFDKVKNKIDVALEWYEKDANRLPEALWIQFNPFVKDSHQWYMDKMGKHISPLDVVSNGNRNLHAIKSGVYYNEEKRVMIETLDAPLVAVGEPKILKFDNQVADLNNGFYINLYNNVWGTNFPMWYDEDSLFRFSIQYS